MTRDVICVGPNCPLREVLAKIHDHRLSCLVVCTDDAPVGLITERDVVGVAVNSFAGGESRRTAEELMSSPVTAVHLHDSLENAVALAMQRRIRRLPVVDSDGRLVGLVTQTDLLRAYTRQIEGLVAARTAELAEANRRLEMLSRQDGLLGIGNRRAMDQSLVQIHATSFRYRRPYSIVLCDLDYFKRYNDLYGHLSGDQALRSVTTELDRITREVDQLYRYGGEEILLLLPETLVSDALTLGVRMCGAVEALGILHQDSPFGVVTISCGVSGLGGSEPVDRDWQKIVRQADEALYHAKRAGRNRVSKWSPCRHDGGKGEN